MCGRSASRAPRRGSWGCCGGAWAPRGACRACPPRGLGVSWYLPPFKTQHSDAEQPHQAHGISTEDRMTDTKPDDLEAVRTIIETLQKFQEADRERILRWTREKLGLPTERSSTPS